MKGGYFEEFQYTSCLSYYTIIIVATYFQVCSCVVLMPPLRNCNVNSHENEILDIKFRENLCVLG